jgi:hypothetical protein
MALFPFPSRNVEIFQCIASIGGLGARIEQSPSRRGYIVCGGGTGKTKMARCRLGARGGSLGNSRRVRWQELVQEVAVEVWKVLAIQRRSEHSEFQGV